MMTSRERVLCALNGGIPDRVPYCEAAIDEPVIYQLLGQHAPEGKYYEAGESLQNPVDLEKAVSRVLSRDNINFNFLPPIPADKHAGEGNILFYGDGLIKSWSDLDKLQLPDPEDDKLYAPAREFLAQKEDFAACARCRLGISPAYLCMGQQTFLTALYDQRDLVAEVLARYCEWSAAVMQRICTLGFDFVWTADDIAFKTGLLFSPEMFRELILPHVRKVAENITLPWIFHSDGDLTDLLEDLLELGISGLHPIEPEAMDIRELKRRMGQRVCLVGNVSVNTLSAGTPDEVADEVKSLLGSAAPGGGYILSSGNSLASYCQIANIRTMVQTLQQYGKYPDLCS